MYTLSADFGTSSVKAAIIDGNDHIVELVKKTYQYKLKSGDMVELEIDDIWQAFISAVRCLKSYLHDVREIGIDTFAPSLIMMDSCGHALCPLITHLDRRSRKYTKKIITDFGKKEYREITGTLPYAGGVTLTSLLWIKDYQPEIYQKTEKVGHLNTYLFKKLTGKWGIDSVNASITGMYETIKGNGWSRKICNSFGIDGKILPTILEGDDAWAPIVPEMAEVFGLNENTMVGLGTQDVASALIGAGLNRSGQMLCISGSSEMIAVLTDNPVTNDSYYLRASGIKGLWQIFSITTGGFALEWFQQQFCQDMKSEDFFNDYLPDVLKNNFCSNGVTFLPYVTGDRQSLRKKKGSFNGLTLETKREDLLCALIEGIQKQSIMTLDACRKMIPLDSVIKATGNLTDNQAYLDVKSRLFGKIDIEVIEQCPIKGNVRKKD